MAELSRIEQDFRDSYWNHERYEGGKMYRCTFVHSRLSDIGLKDQIVILSSIWFWSKLTSVQCRDLRIQLGYFQECKFWDVTLTATSVVDIRFEQSTIFGCKFADTSLQHIRLKKCELSHLTLSQVKLTDVKFDQCIFKEIEWEQLEFEKVTFKNCYFDRLPKTIPEGCKFKHCMEI